MENIVLLLEMLSVYVFLALSLWAFFRKEIKAQFIYLLAAFLGWLLLVGNEFTVILGDARFYYSASYLCFSLANVGYRLIIYRPTSAAGPMEPFGNTKNSYELPRNDEPTDFPTNPLVQEAQRILDEW